MRLRRVSSGILASLAVPALAMAASRACCAQPMQTVANASDRAATCAAFVADEAHARLRAEALALVRSGRPEAAVDLLACSVDAGWTDLLDVDLQDLQREPDLAVLRAQPGWATLRARAARKDKANASLAMRSLKQTLRLARRDAYNSGKVDWAQVKREAQRIAEADPRYGQHRAIRYVVSSLGDMHSFYKPPADVDASALWAPQSGGARDPKAMEAIRELTTRPIARSLVSPGGVPIVQVNGWAGRDYADNIARDTLSLAAGRVRAALNDALATPGCGLIVDLTGDTGGNMWPMLSGLLPLLSAGPVEYFKAKAGGLSVIERRDDGLFYAGVPAIAGVDALPMPVNQPRRIAVLIGGFTASSGEMTALAFRGQANTRFFGQTSAGYTSVNMTYGLRNGGTLGLATSTALDRNRQEYGGDIARSSGNPAGRIVPDAVTAAPMDEAERWIRDACAAGE